MKHTPKTDQELKQLAFDYVAGNLFTNFHIHPNDVNGMLRHIFIPIVFLRDEDLEYMKDMDVMMIYEYMNKAEDRSINGYPIFMSVQMLGRDEHSTFVSHVEEVEKLNKQFVGK